jgi:hypothetical protein
MGGRVAREAANTRAKMRVHRVAQATATATAA